MPAAGRTAIETALVRALSERGVTPDPETYDRVLSRTLERGHEEYQRLTSIAGEGWEELLATAGPELTERDVKRMLGFGHELTRFQTAPVPLSREHQRIVLELGATTNTLGSVFNRLIDRGHRPNRVLSRWGLRAGVLNNRIVDGVYERLVSPRKRAIYRLVSEYFGTLSTLPFASTREPVRRDLHRYIGAMYRAERRSAGGADSARTNMITSVYPFVVMGIPCWFATRTYDKSRYETHINWLRQLGEFVRLIDDAADLREDAAAGAYNAIDARRTVQPDAVVAERIATNGKRVLDRWGELTGSRNDDASPKKVFTTMIVSWLGGPLGYDDEYS
jgi:hypothetical protein